MGVYMIAGANKPLPWTRVRRIIILATDVGVNWNTRALWRDMSEILLIRKDVQKREARTTCGLEPGQNVPPPSME